jgi:hypothetical protein
MKLIRLMFLMLLLCTCAVASVTVQEPVSGTTVSSPVHVLANDPTATHMTIYVDGVSYFAKDTNTIDTSVTIASGDHLVVVQSWDKDGVVDKFPLNLTVSGDTTYTKSINNIDEITLLRCKLLNCGNTGGATGPTAEYNQTLVSSPSSDGKSSKFYVNAAYGTYSNGFWYYKWSNLLTTAPKLVKITFNLYIPQTYTDNYQAIEYQTQIKYGYHVYNLAWQYGYGSHKWRTFDYKNSRWVDTGITMANFVGDTWHKIEAEFSMDTVQHTRRVVALTVTNLRTGESKRYTPTVNVTLPASSTSDSGNYLSAAFQLDSNKYGDAYYVFVDKWSVQYK